MRTSCLGKFSVISGVSVQVDCSYNEFTCIDLGAPDALQLVVECVKSPDFVQLSLSSLYLKTLSLVTAASLRPFPFFFDCSSSRSQCSMVFGAPCELDQKAQKNP